MLDGFVPIVLSFDPYIRCTKRGGPFTPPFLNYSRRAFQWGFAVFAVLEGLDRKKQGVGARDQKVVARARGFRGKRCGRYAGWYQVLRALGMPATNNRNDKTKELQLYGTNERHRQ